MANVETLKSAAKPWCPGSTALDGERAKRALSATGKAIGQNFVGGDGGDLRRGGLRQRWVLGQIL